jgi:hypothetical protein
MLLQKGAHALPVQLAAAVATAATATAATVVVIAM